ncbi:MAG: MFS transporter [Proteobacteria bacterium]|nr:MFS transporter [Pseudomonadota bacterium]
MRQDSNAASGGVSVGLLGRAALIAFGMMSGVANGTLSPILPQIEHEFGASSEYVTVTMALTILGLGVLIGSPLGGWLADRLGRHKVMVCSGVIYGIAGCSIMFAGSLEHVILGRLILGIALGAMGAAAYAVIGDAWDAAGRNFWSGLVTALGTLAGMTLSIVAGLLADTAWRTSFSIYAIGFVAAALALAGIAGGGSSGSASHKGPLLGIPLRLMPAILGFGLIAGSIATGTAAYLPHRMVEVGLMSSSGRAVAALSGAGAVVIVSIAYGWIRRFVSLDLAFVLAAVGSAIGLSVMAFGPTPFAVSLGLGIEGLGIGLMIPSLMIYAIELSDEANRGRVIGVMKGAVFGGPFLVQFLLDPIRLRSGASPVLAILAASAVVMAIYFLSRWLGRERAFQPA